MSLELNLPSINAATADGKINQLSSYLYQLVEKLNLQLGDSVSGDSGQYALKVMGTTGEDIATEEAKNTFSSIKSLIIKSADIVKAYEDQMTLTFNGKYVAQSDFGTFAQATTAAIAADSQRITQNYQNIQVVQGKTTGLTYDGTEDYEYTLMQTTEAYIKTGYLCDEEREGETIPIYGVEIGQTTTTPGQVATYNRMLRISSDRISFYNPEQSSNEVAYVSGNALYIPNGVITGGSIDANSCTISNLLATMIKVGTSTSTVTVADKLTDLQNQIDGSIDTYYHAGEPAPRQGSEAPANYPAEAWVETPALMEAHTGDLYYDSGTNYCYRWVYNSNDSRYEWVVVTDTGVAQALAAAAAAQETANRKCTIYYGEPPAGATLQTGDMKVISNKTYVYNATTQTWSNASDYDTAIVSAVSTLTTSMESGTTTISGDCITTGTLNANLITTGSMSAERITSGTMSASRISGGTFDGTSITLQNLTLGSSSGTTIDGGLITTGTLDAGKITTGTLSADRISGGTLDGNNITCTNLTASNIAANSTISNNFTCSSLNITGGTINIDTTSELTDMIQLNYAGPTQQTYYARMRASGFNVGDDNIEDSVRTYSTHSEARLYFTQMGIGDNVTEHDPFTQLFISGLTIRNSDGWDTNKESMAALNSRRLAIIHEKSTSSAANIDAVNISASGVLLNNTSGYPLALLANNALTFYDGTSAQNVIVKYTNQPKYQKLGYTMSGSYVMISVPNITQYSYFVLQAASKANALSTNLRVVDSITVFPDSAITSNSPTESVVCAFAEDPVTYKVECYFDYANNRAYLKTPGNAWCTAVLYGYR